MTKRLTTKVQVDIVTAFTEDLEPVITLADKYGLTRHGIYKILKRAGIDPKEYGKLDVSCKVCGKIITRHRARVRRQLNHFCCEACYHAFLEAGNGKPYKPSPWGGRVARAKVSEHFELKEGNVVHHENRSQFDNRLSNLRVFATQGDHTRYHRGFDVEPIWDGSKVKLERPKPAPVDKNKWNRHCVAFDAEGNPLH
jgi:hypothetical protein